MRLVPSLPLTLIAGMTLAFSLQASAFCQPTGLQLQVLGSGGPDDSGGRASSAYLLWLDGRSRLLLDAGGGAKKSFHQAGASLADIDLIALSHFHPDHSAALPGVLWPLGAEFTLTGPNGDGDFPSVGRYAEALFGAGGTFADLGKRLTYNVIEIPSDGETVTEVMDANFDVTAIGVPHGYVPTIGYRIDHSDTSIVFSSDQNGLSPEFLAFAKGADYLVIHMGVGEDASERLAPFHARPSVWGQLATNAEVGHVIVSHISTSDSEELARSVTTLRNNYAGEVTVAEDLLCLDLQNIN